MSKRLSCKRCFMIHLFGQNFVRDDDATQKRNQDVRDICSPRTTHVFSGWCSRVRDAARRCRVLDRTRQAGNQMQRLDGTDHAPPSLSLIPAASPSLLLSDSLTGMLELAAGENRSCSLFESPFVLRASPLSPRNSSASPTFQLLLPSHE